jgi:putative FmdB family regulatory protein
MPIYEYSCAKCGKTIEAIQKFSDKPLKKHEKCGGTLTKLISASAFHLKGSGWYKDAYVGKSDAAQGKDGKDESSNGKQDSKAETKESKTDTVTEKTSAKPEAVAPAKPSEKPGKSPKSGATKK